MTNSKLIEDPEENNQSNLESRVQKGKNLLQWRAHHGAKLYSQLSVTELVSLSNYEIQSLEQQVTQDSETFRPKGYGAKFGSDPSSKKFAERTSQLPNITRYGGRATCVLDKVYEFLKRRTVKNAKRDVALLM